MKRNQKINILIPQEVLHLVEDIAKSKNLTLENAFYSLMGYNTPIKKNKSDNFLANPNLTGIIHPARITQKEAMHYVNIGTWESFENWIEKNEVAFSYNGNRKLFRKSELDRAILLDEERAKNLLQQ